MSIPMNSPENFYRKKVALPFPGWFNQYEIRIQFICSQPESDRDDE